MEYVPHSRNPKVLINLNLHLNIIRSMIRLVSEILEFLAVDGEWHTVEEVAEALGLDVIQVSKVLKEISEFHFVEFDEQGRVRVDPKFRRLPV